MNLVTPDSGLLFWMVLIFLIVLGILWKFGFPMITGMVEKRTAHIDDSLRLAREAEERMKGLAEEQKKLIEDTQRQQSQMLKDAASTRDAIIAQARDEARQQADIMIEKAKVEIAAEKEEIAKRPTAEPRANAVKAHQLKEPREYAYRFACGDPDVVEQIVKLLDSGPKAPAELRKAVGMRNRTYFNRYYLAPLLANGVIERTDSANPNSPQQRYRKVG